MIKSLLVTVAALTVLSASAQLKNPHAGVLQQDRLVTNVRSQALKQEVHQASEAEPFQKAPKKEDGSISCRYVRPAGAFSGSIVLEHDAYGYEFLAPYIMLKPYVPYTFKSVTEGLDDSHSLVWGYQLWVTNQSGEWEQQWFYEIGPEELDVKYGCEVDEVPILYVAKGDEEVASYQMGNYKNSVVDDGVSMTDELIPCHVFAAPTYEDPWQNSPDLLLSSKTFCTNGSQYMTNFYDGAIPWADNMSGWWFGKNGGLPSGGRIDGIAQAFEKPTSPYVLRKVVLWTSHLSVDAPVDLTCKIYRLSDGIPAYDPAVYVTLPEEPGELIAIGHATVTPETAEENDGFIVFTLYGEDDGLEYEITPEIDDNILIAIDGYNDVDMENLRDFTAMISSDYHVDEGYGELAYLKYGAPDAEGNFSGDYVWAGLNNFFSIGEMKTGLTIFMVADYPYLAFNRPDIEDGEYTFDRVGGMLYRQVFGGFIPGIEFKAWKPSADDEWEMTCNGEEIPDWLEIELIDGEEEGEFNNIVTAQVFADPLPEGLSYREAIVRFSFAGAYIDYKFIQGEKIGPTPPCPCSGDYGYEGEVTIANLNCMIDYMIEGMYDDCLDLNEDGEFTIADINVLIDYILLY